MAVVGEVGMMIIGSGRAVEELPAHYCCGRWAFLVGG